MLIPQVGSPIGQIRDVPQILLGACLVLGILMVICMYNLEFKRK